MGQNSTKEDLEFATELNLFFKRFDTTPTPVCLDSVPSGSPALLRSMGTIKDVAISPSLSSTMTLKDSPSSPSSSPPPNTHMSLEGVASQPPSSSTTGQPLLVFHNSLHSTPSPSLTLTPSQVERELSRHRMSKASGPDNISPRVLKACAGQLAGVITLTCFIFYIILPLHLYINTDKLGSISA